jgi:hypothetical protein
MSKVASQSWIEAARNASAGDPVHCHYVMPSNLERIEAAIHDPARRQTISNMVVPNYILRSGRQARVRIDEARQSGEQVRVITGMRDPVARSISLIVFFADFVGHTERPLRHRTPLSADVVIATLQEIWTAVLERREPDGTFEWLLWFLVGAYRNWFREELAPAFDADVFGTVFNRETASQRIKTPVAELLAYRVEDMTPDSPLCSRLLDQAGEFLGAPISSFPNVNMSEARGSRAVSDEVRQRLRMSAEMIDAIYDDATVRHFYTSDEIAAFKVRWTSR